MILQETLCCHIILYKMCIWIEGGNVLQISVQYLSRIHLFCAIVKDSYVMQIAVYSGRIATIVVIAVSSSLCGTAISSAFD